MARIYLSPPDMGEEERNLLLDAFDSNWITTTGAHVKAFEEELASRVGVAHAVALSSGTAGLHLALRILGVGPGDEVLTSTLTFAATANAITYQGAEPVFIDSEAESWNLDPALLAEELEACAGRGRLPKAVIVVHLYGQCADMDPILEACAAHGVPVIEDAAEALGATYKDRPAGSIGCMGIFSFNGNKIITTSGGGMLVSASEDWMRQALYLSSQAREPVIHYEHTCVGYNYRLSNLLAAVGRGQLGSLDVKVEKRRETFARYQGALGDLPGVVFQPEPSWGRSTRWLTCLTLDGTDPEKVRLHLEAQDIEARPVWKPMHLQPVFQGCRTRGGALAEDLFRRGLCLPSGSGMSDADRDRVIRAVREVWGA